MCRGKISERKNFFLCSTVLVVPFLADFVCKFKTHGREYANIGLIIRIYATVDTDIAYTWLQQDLHKS